VLRNSHRVHHLRLFCCVGPTYHQISRTDTVLGSYLAVGNSECDSHWYVSRAGQGHRGVPGKFDEFRSCVLNTVAACIPEAGEEYAVVCHLCVL
jgi:hypothetical protein